MAGSMFLPGTPSGVVASEDDKEEDGLEAAAAVLAGGMGVDKVGMVMLDTGAGSGSTEATL